MSPSPSPVTDQVDVTSPSPHVKEQRAEVTDQVDITSPSPQGKEQKAEERDHPPQDVPPTEMKDLSGNEAIVIDDNSPDPPPWLTIESCCAGDPSVHLYMETKTRILKRTTWLSDTELHAGQLLLKSMFPYIDGLSDPAVKGSLVIPVTSEFVQILNTGSHWVCMSTIGMTSNPGTIKIFDSAFYNPSPTAIEHACRMLMYPGHEVTFVNEKVQKQVGSSDCGLFALAFATDLCHGLDPLNQKYDQRFMRQHYVSCLENGAMTSFPKTVKRVPLHLGCKKTSIAIYCVCRLPNDKKEYIECFKCREWYHPTCVTVPAWALNSNKNWKCDKCKEASARLKTSTLLTI